MTPVKYNIRKRQQSVSVFRGINRGVNTAMSKVSSKNSSLYMEFKDMKNVTLDDYPAIRTREKRHFLGKKNVMYDSAIISNILATSYGVVYLENSGRLCFGNSYCILFQPTPESEQNRRLKRTLCEFGNSIVVMPDKVIVTPIDVEEGLFDVKNIEKTFKGKDTQSGYIRRVALNTSVSQKNHYIEDISINLLDKENQKQTAEHEYKEFLSKLQLGDMVENINTSPSTIYLVTEIKSGEDCSEYLNSRIVTFTIMYNTYVKIECAEIGRGFAVDDWVRISEVEEADKLNSSYKIVERDTDYIVINCETDKSLEFSGKITVERKMPADMDYMVSIDNRMWGCSSKENRIYASRLGDVTNWEAYGDGISTDSYWVDVSTSGEFTGAVVSSNAVYFFKENCIHRIIGTKPRNYTVTVLEDLGIKKGSHNSVVWVRDRLFYHSPVGVCVYSPGGEPVVISEVAFGKDRYMDAVAGKHRDKYYISLKNARTKEYELYVYDLNSSQWTKEDNLCFTSADTYNNLMYFVYADTGYIGCIETQEDNLLKSSFEHNELINYENNKIGELVEGTEVVLGDVDNDGMITIEDSIKLQMILNTAGALDELTTEEKERISIAADIDENGIVNISDVTELQKWIDVPELYSEGNVEFMLESGDLYEYYPNKKYIQKIELLTELSRGAKLSVAVSCDGKPFEEVKTLYADRKREINIPLRPGRCYSFRIKLYGYGDFTLYNITFTTEGGGR